MHWIRRAVLAALLLFGFVVLGTAAPVLAAPPSADSGPGCSGEFCCGPNGPPSTCAPPPTQQTIVICTDGTGGRFHSRSCEEVPIEPFEAGKTAGAEDRLRGYSPSCPSDASWAFKLGYQRGYNGTGGPSLP